MTITAINTLEIRLIEEADQRFELSLKEYAAVFENVPECMGYSVTRSIYESNLWVFSGYWSAESAMTAHFKSESMTALVNHLMASCANLTFSSFAPQIGGAQHDET